MVEAEYMDVSLPRVADPVTQTRRCHSRSLLLRGIRCMSSSLEETSFFVRTKAASLRTISLIHLNTEVPFTD